ncbi:hypothetical protein Sango_2469500 [Sesamum angolense]|uniref:NECAP PHear domain-containing protein n=1 Tax=Sesamum angolense TaxID=2727404 RepID=A0AAE1W3M1_9LAMI|nr:hypothetical protein Sango_2469500 [Sesamum angolense]
MEKEKKSEENAGEGEELEEALELVLFHVSECYVYLIPPRKTAASYRADEWNVNKWAWEGTLKVILYLNCYYLNRYFVLRVEENIGGRLRHAFIGIGFRERTEAYDFQAALHDHMKYLNKKKTAEEMEQQFQNTSSVDYSLKWGDIGASTKQCGGSVKSKFFEQGLNNLQLDDKSRKTESTLSIKLPPPPPPPAPLSPVAEKSPSDFPTKCSPDRCSEVKASKSEKDQPKESESAENKSSQDIPDDDFGDFQAAG